MKCVHPFGTDRHKRQADFQYMTSPCPKRELQYQSNLPYLTEARWDIPFGPVHEIANSEVCATSKASDQPAHTRSLIRAFASRLSIL